MALIGVVEIDPVLRNAIKLLHSNAPDSAEKLRFSLDEIIKARYGDRKMLKNTLSKKHLAEEGVVSQSQSLKRSHSENKSKTTVIQEEATIIPDEPIMVEMSGHGTTSLLDEDMMEEDQLKELEELVCVVCRRVDVNHLVECSDCHSLYHQECHKPPISEAEASENNTWLCTLCKSKLPLKIAAPASPTPTSSSSSNSSSKSSSSSHYSSKHSSSKSQKKSSSSKSGSSSSNHSSANNSKSGGTTTSSIISADKRLAHMKKKLQDNKRKNK